MARFLWGGLLLLVACTPTVQLQAPEKPIEINVNVKIEQEIRVKVDDALSDQFARNPELFGVPARPSQPKE